MDDDGCLGAFLFLVLLFIIVPIILGVVFKIALFGFVGAILADILMGA